MLFKTLFVAAVLSFTASFLTSQIAQRPGQVPGKTLFAAVAAAPR